MQDDSRIFIILGRKKVLKKNDGNMKQRHKNQLEGVPTGEIWDHLSTKIIMQLNELYTIEKMESLYSI